jgi:hypothetical protein
MMGTSTRRHERKMGRATNTDVSVIDLAVPWLVANTDA